MAEIGIAVFRPQRPIVGEGVFETPADGPARASTCNWVYATKGKVVEVRKVGEDGAAGAVDKDAVPGDAEAGTDRTLNRRLGLEDALEKWWEGAHYRRPAQARAVDIAFEADDYA